MPISDLCAKEIISVEKGASLQYAAQLMKKHNIGSVVVVASDGSNKPIGILTDRDIVLSVVAENWPLTTKVKEAMSTNVTTVSKTEGIAEVVDKMAEHGVRRVVVVDQEGNACGLASSDDVLQLVAREMNSLGHLVQRQTENEKSRKPISDRLMI